MARIGISVDEAIGNSGGVGMYIRMLIQGLVQVAPQHQYVLVYADRGVQPTFIEAGSNIKFCAIPWSPRLLQRILWPVLGWPPVEQFTGKLDLFHVATSAFRIPVNCPYVVTVYDLFPELYPSYFKSTGRYLRKTLLQQMKTADHLIAISESTRKDALEYLHVPPEKITTGLLGLNPVYADTVPDETILERLNVQRKRYFLFVGRIDYRKNVDTLIKAYARYAQSDDAYPLILAGSQGAQSNEIIALIDELHLMDKVIRPGYLPMDAIKALTLNASAFVYPSRHEGFGFPVLEANFCHTPIIVSNSGSLQEVADSGAFFVDPNSAGDLALALARVSSDADLRNSLIQRGEKNLERFYWLTLAEVAAQVYELVLRNYPL